MLFVVSAGKIFSQLDHQLYLDSIFIHYVFMRTSQNLSESTIKISPEQKKCGFNLAANVFINFEKFNSYQKSILKKLLQRPITDTSFISPSGFFRIHYNKTGPDAPVYSLNQLASALDSVYKYEITFLGYPPPPPDNGMGGDNRFDIYITNLGSDYYGFTQPEYSIGNSRFTSYTVIDNDYIGYPTSGIDGAKVTVAHEFHHAIQIGNYIYREADIFYYEISSTAMEEFVFDDINDYYFYMTDYFNNPSRPFILNNGYNLAIWNIFLQQNFGHQLLKRIWELMPNHRALTANYLALNERGTSFGEQFNKFGLWNYFTGYKSIRGKFYDEAENYPIIKTSNPMPFNPPSRVYSMNSKVTTNYYLKINSGLDTLVVIISNSDVVNGIDSTNKVFSFNYNLYSDTSRGTRKLGGIFSADFDSPYQNFFNVSEILNNIIINGDSNLSPTKNNRELFAFPNPFSFNKKYFYGEYLNIQINNTIVDEILLNVFSSSMQLIFSKYLKSMFLPNGSKGVKWDLRDNNGELVSSGVYFITVKIGDKVLRDKIVVLYE